MKRNKPLDLKKIEKKIIKKGWKKIKIEKGYSQYNKIASYMRISHLSKRGEIRGEGIGSPNTPKNKGLNSNVLGKGSYTTMGRPIVANDPSKFGVDLDEYMPDDVLGLDIGFNSLAISDPQFSGFKSIASLRSDSDCLSIGFDTEWVGDLPRRPLSYQFSVVKDSILYEIVILNIQEDPTQKLSLEMCLGVVFHVLGYKSYRTTNFLKQQACVGFDAAGKPKWKIFEDPVYFHSEIVHPLFPYKKDGRVLYKPHSKTADELSDLGEINLYAPNHSRDWLWSRSYIDFPDESYTKVQLICHAGNVDLSLFDVRNDDFDGFNNIFRYVHDIQGGVMSLTPTRRYPVDFNIDRKNRRLFPITLSIRDTMGQATPKHKSLDSLGDVINIPKLNDKYIRKDDMLWTLENHPSLFFDYASRDSTVTLLYFSSLYGYNKQGDVTLSSAGARVMKDIMMDYLGAPTSAEFDRVYRGLKKVKKGLVPHPNRAGFIEESNKEPINRLTGEIQEYCSQAYHGGFNGSSYIGWFEKETFDFDLQGAYPTAMSVVPDINWENPVQYEIQHRNLTLEDFNIPVLGEYPLLAFAGYVRFEFPDDVKFPSIPISVDGSLVFPLTSDGIDGVFACGPEIFVALKLGATVYCDRGFVFNTLRDDDGKESRSLAHAVHDLLLDRKNAKEKFGSGSLIELLLKALSTNGYGKTSQNVIKKQAWSSYCKEMENLGASAITNPFAACMTTSIVRAELIAIMNEITSAGYNVYSVTTDGFITDMEESLVKEMPMLGFRRWMSKARLYLTNGVSDEIWEVKHKQTNLLNLTTRGNMSLDKGGVSAHNSTRSPFSDKDPDYELKDRLWFITQCLSRVDAVSYVDSVWTQFKELALGEPFQVKKTVKNVKMDFDLKRKPDRTTFKTVFPVIDCVKYEIVNFDTLPYRNVDECRKYRNTKNNVKCLRTESDWDLFYFKLKTTRQKVRDMKWAILNSCVMGHRVGLWVIEELDYTDWTVQDKCDWLNSLGLSPNRTFKESDWKNARRPERVSSILPLTLLKPALIKLNARMK